MVIIHWLRTKSLSQAFQLPLSCADAILNAILLEKIRKFGAFSMKNDAFFNGRHDFPLKNRWFLLVSKEKMLEKHFNTSQSPLYVIWRRYGVCGTSYGPVIMENMIFGLSLDFASRVNSLKWHFEIFQIPRKVKWSFSKTRKGNHLWSFLSCRWTLGVTSLQISQS